MTRDTDDNDTEPEKSNAIESNADAGEREPEQRSGLPEESKRNDQRPDVRGEDDTAQNVDRKRSGVTDRKPRDSPVDREVRPDGKIDVDKSQAGTDRDPASEARSRDTSTAEDE